MKRWDEALEKYSLPLGITAVILGAVLAVLVIWFVFLYDDSAVVEPSPVDDGSVACTEDAMLCPDGSYVGRVAPDCEFEQCPVVNNAEEEATDSIVPTEEVEAQEAPELYYPIATFNTQITKKPFGIYITPASSPVSPERFSGYHNAVDVEVTDEQQDEDVPVYAIADGTVKQKSAVSGYGGLLVIENTIDGATYTALYGHVRLSSITKDVGEGVEAGEQIAVLGEGFSVDTDGERKHLHFSLQSGLSSDIRGYVTAQSALKSWINPVTFFEARSVAQPQ